MNSLSRAVRAHPGASRDNIRRGEGRMECHDVSGDQVLLSLPAGRSYADLMFFLESAVELKGSS